VSVSGPANELDLAKAEMVAIGDCPWIGAAAAAQLRPHRKPAFVRLGFVAPGSKRRVGHPMVENRFDIDPRRSAHQPDEDPPEAQPVSDAGPVRTERMNIDRHREQRLHRPPNNVRDFSLDRVADVCVTPLFLHCSGWRAACGWRGTSTSRSLSLTASMSGQVQHGSLPARLRLRPRAVQDRNTVERCIDKLKQHRAVAGAARDDKRQPTYEGSVDVASICIGLRSGPQLVPLSSGESCHD
jgi:hypothetical protein